MIFGSDNPVLLTDLDAKGFNLINCGFIQESTLVENDDIRLYDPRPVLDGSVTDASVAEDAAIMQSKLLLNGTIPTAWLGGVNTTDFPVAARGDLVEYVVATPATSEYALRTADTPPSQSGGSFRLGNTYKFLVAAQITGARFYRNASSGFTTRQMFLFSLGGTLLATSSSTSLESGSGWFNVTFSPPIAAAVNDQFTIAYDETAVYNYAGFNPVVADPAHIQFVDCRYKSVPPFSGAPGSPTLSSHFFVDLLFIPPPIGGKNGPDGYPGLDANGHMAPSTIPPGPGSGTLSEIALLVPGELYAKLTTTGTLRIFDVFWQAVPPVCWFGLNLPDPGHDYPRFNEEPVSLDKVPVLPGTKFSTGTFNADNLPLAIGVGGAHAPGMVPDPGTGKDGNPSDYLARDMSFKPMSTGIAYQPTLSSPSITVMYVEAGLAMVSLSSPVPGANLFFSVGNGFAQIPEHQGFQVPFGTLISVYAAKIGWNNSAIFNDIIPEAPIPGGGEEPPPP